MVVSVATPLCPAGHLPLRGGDWMGQCFNSSSTFLFELGLRLLPLSPLEGEMPGRAEGGAPSPRSLRSAA